MLNGKNILIGITGGIAAYKICELIRLFKKQNANVKVICTPNAMNFVTKTTLQSLSQNEVYVDQYMIEDFKPEHISLADEADIFVIAPISANTIGKIANGICDNLLTSVACAFQKPVIIAPAMNSGMWNSNAVQGNLKKLDNEGYHILAPEDGFLACGTSGRGRLCDIGKIFDKTVEILAQSKTLLGQKIVVTAGGTIEEIDAVRYLSNYSSGKMGICLADRAYELGADVVLITTVRVEKPYEIIGVKSAEEMKQVVESEFANADCIIMAAAVADYRAKTISEKKLKKTEENEITMKFVKNPDILKGLCEMKAKAKGKTPLIIGFCAESEDLLKNAEKKIAQKGCDFLIANDISRKDIGFASNYNEVTVFRSDGGMKKLEKATKKEIAKQIFEEIYG